MTPARCLFVVCCLLSVVWCLLFVCSFLVVVFAVRGRRAHEGNRVLCSIPAHGTWQSAGEHRGYVVYDEKADKFQVSHPLFEEVAEFLRQDTRDFNKHEVCTLLTVFYIFCVTCHCCVKTTSNNHTGLVFLSGTAIRRVVRCHCSQNCTRTGTYYLSCFVLCSLFVRSVLILFCVCFAVARRCAILAI